MSLSLELNTVPGSLLGRAGTPGTATGLLMHQLVIVSRINFLRLRHMQPMIRSKSCIAQCCWEHSFQR
jgi:hypothetical protein